MENKTIPTAITVSQINDIGVDSNLTRLQLLYWIGQGLRSNSPLFNVVVTFRLQTSIDENLFSEAFAAVVGQSDALRTVIREEGSVPQRIILPEPPRPLELLDFSNEEDPEVSLQEWLTVRSQRPLEISQCIYDVVLIKLARDAYFWYLNQHHMVVDAASVFIVYRRVMTFYQEATESGTITLEPDIPAFAAYVEFEKGYRESPRYKKSAVFWRKRMAEGIDPLKFYGRPPHKKSHRMQRIAYELDLKRSQQLKETMQRPGVFNMTYDLGMLNVLLVLYFALLHFMTGNRRMATMMPFHNRPTKLMKRTIGLLMEICPILVTLEHGETFASLAKKVSTSLRQTLIHYQYGTAVALNSHLTDLMFNFHQRPELYFAGKPVQQKLIHPQAGSDSFALHVHEFEADGSFTFFFDFHEDVFTQPECDLTLAAFEQLLTSYLMEVEEPVDALDLPTAVSPLAAVNRSMPADDPGLTEPAYIPPGNEIEQKLVATWENVLGITGVGIHDNFFDLGGNSWRAMRLFAELQTVMGKNLPLATLFQAPTIAALAAVIRQGEMAEGWSSLVPIRAEGSRPPFFCIHGVTGDVLWLRELANCLDDDQPFYGLQARGLDGEAEPFIRLEEMAAYYLQQIKSFQPLGPYFLGGYCMGGSVAYEVARQLKAQGEDVPILIVIDPPPANLSERAPVNGRFLIDFVQNGPLWLREFMRLGRGEISSRVRRKGRLALRSLWQKIRFDSTGEGLNASDLIDQAGDLPAYRQRLIDAHLEALLHYSHPGYNGEVVVFAARSRPLLNLGDNAGEWASFVQRPVTLRTVPGSHSSMLHQPHVAKLASWVQQSLDQARPSPTDEVDP